MVLLECAVARKVTGWTRSVTWQGVAVRRAGGSRRPRRRPRRRRSPRPGRGAASTPARDGPRPARGTGSGRRRRPRPSVVVATVDRGIEAEPVELGHEGLEARRRRRCASRRRLGPARGRPRRRPRRRRRPPRPGARASGPASGTVGGSRPSDGRVGRQRVEVLGPADARRAPRVRTSSRPTSRMRSRWGRTVLGCRPSDLGDVGRGQRAGASGPARGRWRSGCCRRAPSAGRGGVRRHRPTRATAEITRHDPVKCRAHDPPTRHARAPVPGPPTVDDVLRAAPRRHRPRARRRHRRPRAWPPAPRVDARRRRHVIGIKLTIGGCPLRAQIKKDVETRVAVAPRRPQRAASTGAR